MYLEFHIDRYFDMSVVAETIRGPKAKIIKIKPIRGVIIVKVTHKDVEEVGAWVKQVKREIKEHTGSKAIKIRVSKMVQSQIDKLNENKNKLEQGKEIPYWDIGPVLKTGISAHKPDEGRGQMELEDGTTIVYNQFESWWETANRPAASNPKAYNKWVSDIYDAAGSPEDARYPEFNPFR